MRKPFKRTKDLTVEFCERGSQVIDAGSRSAALRERALLQQLSLGIRV